MPRTIEEAGASLRPNKKLAIPAQVTSGADEILIEFEDDEEKIYGI